MRNSLESTMLEIYEDNVRKDGCEFILDPTVDKLPEELSELKPDAIALCPTENRVIVARTLQEDTAEVVQQYTIALKARNDWKFVLLWAPEMDKALDFIDASLAEITEKVSDLERIPEDLSEARLLALFPILEKIARMYLPVGGRSRISSSSLIEAIANAGLITPTEADGLRAIGRKRNALSHGASAESVSKEEFELLEKIIVDVSNLMLTDVKEAKKRLQVAVEKIQASKLKKNAVPSSNAD